MNEFLHVSTSSGLTWFLRCTIALLCGWYNEAGRYSIPIMKSKDTTPVVACRPYRHPKELQAFTTFKNDTIPTEMLWLMFTIRSCYWNVLDVYPLTTTYAYIHLRKRSILFTLYRFKQSSILIHISNTVVIRRHSSYWKNRLYKIENYANV